jgi:hypothetical protein
LRIDPIPILGGLLFPFRNVLGGKLIGEAINQRKVRSLEIRATLEARLNSHHNPLRNLISAFVQRTTNDLLLHHHTPAHG